MKKIVGFAITMIAMVVMAAAQTKPIMGYDKVEWGASPAKVKEIYNIPDAEISVDKEDSNITTLSIENVSDKISDKTFMFNGNKLYRVWVTYTDTSEANAKSLAKALIKTYGEYKTDYKNESQNLPFFGYVTLEEWSWNFTKYYPELSIRIARFTKNSSSLGRGGESLTICYTWDRFRDEYQNSKQEF